MKWILALITCLSLHAQTALVAHTGAQSSAGGTITTSAINTTGANFIAVCITAQSVALTDSKSNTWTAFTAQTNNHTTQLFYAFSPTVGTGHTFTQTGASTFGVIMVAAFSGVTAYDSITNGSNGGGGMTNTTIQAGSITPSQANDLIIACEGQEQTSTPTIDSSYIITDAFGEAAGAAYGGGLAYFSAPSTAATNPTWNSNGTGSRMTASIAGFTAHPFSSGAARRGRAIGGM